MDKKRALRRQGSAVAGDDRHDTPANRDTTEGWGEETEGAGNDRVTVAMTGRKGNSKKEIEMAMERLQKETAEDAGMGGKRGRWNGGNGGDGGRVK